MNWHTLTYKFIRKKSWNIDVWCWLTFKFKLLLSIHLVYDQEQCAANHLSTRGPLISRDLHSHDLLSYYWELTIFPNYGFLSTTRIGCIQFNATDSYAITLSVLRYLRANVTTTLNYFKCALTDYSSTLKMNDMNDFLQLLAQIQTVSNKL